MYIFLKNSGTSRGNRLVNRYRLLAALSLSVLMALSPMFVGAISNDQAATLVLGQTNLNSNRYGTNSTDFDIGATAIAFDHSGNAWVTDWYNNRVLEFTYPFSTGEAASIVLGQASFTTGGSASPPTASSMYRPIALIFDSAGDLWVADSLNNRILEFVPGTLPCSAGQFCTGMPASLVLGQSTFTSNSYGTTSTTMYYPYGLTFDSSGNLWVAEFDNNRVTEFTHPFSTGEAASLVLGQSTFTASGFTPSATGIDEPVGIAFDHSGNLWVSQLAAYRVTEFVPGTSPCTSGQFCNDMPASHVIGQGSFTSVTSATNSTNFNAPAGLAFDSSGNLWVSDDYNNRVLEFVQGSGFTNHEAASVVLGQSGFTSAGNGHTSTSMYEPWGITFDSSGNLWVGDYENNRVLEFQGSSSTTTTSSTTSSSTTSVSSSTTPALVCPGTAGGALMPAGATFTDSSGHSWLAPSGNDGGGKWSSYFFSGSKGTIPAPMMQGWGGDYGTYGGQQGWVVTFYC
jgi:sugar lactone lactonase YvrE